MSSYWCLLRVIRCLTNKFTRTVTCRNIFVLPSPGWARRREKCSYCVITKVTTIRKSRRCFRRLQWSLASCCTGREQDYVKRLGTIWRNIMNSNNDFDAILDKATSEIRNEQIDQTVVNKAAERVWARVAVEPATMQKDVAARIDGCADLQSLIPAYLSGTLSEARSLLLVDHTHECIPCRKAMKDARTRTVRPVKTATARSRYHISPVILRWGVAAVLVIGLGLVALPLIQRWTPGGALEATVQAAEGQVFQIADTRS